MRVGWMALAMLATGCGPIEPKATKERDARTAQADARRLKRACGSAETYDRLKALAFDEAVRVRRAPSPVLDRLAASTVVRMERPVVKTRDETLNVTVCTGHLVLELPPGSADAFDGDRRLEADVEYAAQEAVDGSGLVYQIKGAEPIIYRLAASDLSRGAGPAATDRGETAALPAPVPDTTAVPAPYLLPPAATGPAAASEPVRPAPPVRQPSPAIAPERQPVTRPSFNCRNARIRVERMVCGSEGLARADRAMSSAFYAALAGSDGQVRAELRASRDRFLAFRDRCGSEACVLQAYADRTAEIRDIARGY